MIVRGEDTQRRNVFVVFIAGTIYHSVAVVGLVERQFIQSSLVLNALAFLPYPFRSKRSAYNDGKPHLIATIYFHNVALLESYLFRTSATKGLVGMAVVFGRVAYAGIVGAETRTAEGAVNKVSLSVVHSNFCNKKLISRLAYRSFDDLTSVRLAKRESASSNNIIA